MTTPRQLDANRRNAKLSTGPKSNTGKAAAAKNALKHGLLSREALLPEENPLEYAKFTEKILLALEPADEVERDLAERIGLLSWRLKRMTKFESGILRWERAKAEQSPSSLRSAILERGQRLDIDVYAELQGEAYVCSLGALATLSRYETSMDRSWHKALHELQRLQAARKGQYVPPPQAVDFNVTLSRATAGGDSADLDDWMRGPNPRAVDNNVTDTSATASGDKADSADGW